MCIYISMNIIHPANGVSLQEPKLTSHQFGPEDQTLVTPEMYKFSTKNIMSAKFKPFCLGIIIVI